MTLLLLTYFLNLQAQTKDTIIVDKDDPFWITLNSQTYTFKQGGITYGNGTQYLEWIRFRSGAIENAGTYQGNQYVFKNSSIRTDTIELNCTKYGVFRIEIEHKYEDPENYLLNTGQMRNVFNDNTGNGVDTIWINCPEPIVDPVDTVIVVPPPKIDPCGTFYVPTIFDPDSRVSNSNGNNYEFRPFGLNTDYYRLMVYTKTGNRVYDSDVQENEVYTLKSWDGSFLGKPCNSGIYTWHIQFYVNKQLHNCSGDVSLKRNNEDTNP